MTREEIESFTDEELRVRVAEKISGKSVELRRCIREPECGSVFEIESLAERGSEDKDRPGSFLWPCIVLEEGVYDEAPDYPNDIAACWRDIVGPLGKRENCDHISLDWYEACPERKEEAHWVFEMHFRQTECPTCGVLGWDLEEAEAPSASIAICRAYLMLEEGREE